MSFIRIRLPGPGRTVGLTDRPQALSITVGDDLVYTFDRAGRLITVFRGGEFYRRGLDHRLLYKRRGPDRRWRTDVLLPETARSTYEALFDPLIRIAADLRNSPAEIVAGSRGGRGAAGVAGRLHTILANGPDALALDGRRFAQVYSPVAVLPPDRYLALVLQITQGCSHNRCRFCTLYRDIRFRVKSAGELETHIDGVIDFFGAGLSLRQSIFLGDANALVIDPARLQDFLGRISRRFSPRNSPANFGPRGIYSFVDSFHTGFDDPGVWKAFRRAGLTGVYLGVESGSDGLLAAMNKPASRRSTERAVKVLKGAGLQVGAIFIVGLGGRPWARTHTRETSELLQALPLDRRDVVFFSPYLRVEGDPAHGDFEPELAPAALDAQWRRLVEPLQARPREARPRTAVYSLREFIY
jgi:hypothetical protein